MIRLLTAAVLFASAAFAQVEIPHVHENGDVIDADEINQNLDIVANVVPPRDCSTNQIIKWDGSAWVCSSSERVDAEANGDGTGGTQTYATATCPEGKKVTGGSCLCVPCPQCNSLMLINRPKAYDLNAWECGAMYVDQLVAHAICQ